MLSTSSIKSMSSLRPCFNQHSRTRIPLSDPSLAAPRPYDMWDPQYDSCDPFQVKRDSVPSYFGSPGSSAAASDDDLGAHALRNKTILSSRARRQRESSLMQQLAHTLPLRSLSGSKGRPLDKTSILRLALSYMKITRILQQLGLNSGTGGTRNSAPLPAGLEGSFEEALGDGFLIVVKADGDMVYVSRETLNSIGFLSTEMIGASIYEWTHPSDQTDIQHLLHAKLPGVFRSALVRFKLSVFVAPSSYKVFQVNGKLFQEPATGNFFIGMVQPIPHPADNGLPFFVWCSQQIFVTFVSPDMRCMTDAFMQFVKADSQSLHRFLGFSTRDRFGRLCYDYIHPEDAQAVTKSVKTVYSKGQSVEYFRFLRRHGGFVQVFTQSTALDANGKITAGNPSVIICRHHVVNVYDTDEIVAGIQLDPPGVDDGQASPAAQSSPSPYSDSPPPSRSSSESETESTSSTCLDSLDFDLELDLDGLGPVSPQRLENELNAMDLVPADEMHALDIYLQQHLSTCDTEYAEYGYGQLQSNTMMELTSW